MTDFESIVKVTVIKMLITHLKYLFFPSIKLQMLKNSVFSFVIVSVGKMQFSTMKSYDF